MSFIINKEIPLLVSSNPNAGAKNIRDNGSSFEVDLQDGLKIPKDAINCQVRIEESTVWWTVPNIIQGVNDKFYVTGPNTADVITNFVATIPTGLYDLSGINQAILRDLENQGAKINPNPLITLTPDEPTQKVELRIDYNNVSVDFTKTDTPREILGFNSSIIGPFPTPTNVLAPNVAQFNQVNYFLIHTDLTNKGIRINNKYNQTLGVVLIDVAPGSQIVSKPFNPARVNAPELVGTNRTRIRMWLTDDSDRRINTNGEYWTARMVISYQLPMVIKKIAE